jgi:hypothetical protein
VAIFNAEQINKRKDNPNYKIGQGNFKKKKDSGSSSASTRLDQFYKPAEWWKLDQKVRDKILVLCKDQKASAAATVDEGNTTEETTTCEKKVKFETWPAKKDTVVGSVSTVVAAVATPAEDLFRFNLDSHTDSCHVGNGVWLWIKTEQVTPFLKSFGSVHKVPIVTGAITYDHPKTGEMSILLVHQDLQFPEMNNCLLSPMQLWLNDVEVNKLPTLLTVAPTSKDYAITADELLILLELHSLTSFFNGRKPTMKEYEECARTKLMYPHPHWSQHDEMFAEEEALQNKFDDEPRSIRMIKAEHNERGIEQDLVNSLRVALMASELSDR